MSLDRIRAFLSRRSEFFKNVARVSLGQIGATALTFLAVPIVARLYAPADFGSVQLMLSIIGTLVVLSTWKYEMVIVIADDESESRAATLLCLVVIGSTSLAFLAGFLTGGDALLRYFDAEQLQPYAPLLALGVMTSALLVVARSHLIAKKKFSTYSTNSIAQVASTQTLSISWGLLRPDFFGLFASQILGQVVSTALAFLRVPLRLRGIGLPRALEVAKKHRKFPLVNTPGVFVNTLGSELPVFLLARFFDADILGFYMLTNRLLNQPMLLLGQAVAKVYLNSAAEAGREGGESLLRLYTRTLSRLALLGLVPAAVVVFLGPLAVEIVLGSEWEAVGRYMQILMVLKYSQFISAPLSTTLSVVGRQELGVYVMVASTIMRFAAMYWFSDTPESMLLALSVSGTLANAIYVFVPYRVLAGRPNASG